MNFFIMVVVLAVSIAVADDNFTDIPYRRYNHDTYITKLFTQDMPQMDSATVPEYNAEPIGGNRVTKDTLRFELEDNLIKTEEEENFINLRGKAKNNIFKEILKKVKSLERTRGCPEGYFLYPASNQCFMYFGNANRTSWAGAKTKCASVGGVLAKPYDPVGLRDYIVMRYGSYGNFAWLGARGTGSAIKWDRDGVILDNGLPVWWSGHPGSYKTTSHCLRLVTWGPYLKSYPKTAFYMTTCTSTIHFVCEYIRD